MPLAIRAWGYAARAGARSGKINALPLGEEVICSFLIRIQGMKLENFIGGAFVAPSAGRYIDSYHPATGQVNQWLVLMRIMN